MKPQNCQCFFDALLVDQKRVRNNGFKTDQLKKVYRAISRKCHPDKVPASQHEAATQAQTLINIAYEILGDKDKQREYILSRQPPDFVSHKCLEMQSIIQWISDQFRRVPGAGQEKKEQNNQPEGRQGEQDNDTRNATNSEQTSPPPRSPSVIDIEETSDTDDNMRDDSEPNRGEDFSNSYNYGPKDKDDSERVKRRRRSAPESFSPKGYQLEGGEIINYRAKREGSRYLMAWQAKPGYTTWLDEKDIAIHFPEAAREYIDKLKRTRSRRINTILRNATPFSQFL